MEGLPKITNSAGTENFNNQYIVLSVTSGVLHFFGDSLVPDTINKNFPEGAKVLQQVDNKFIPIVASTVLDITDQPSHGYSCSSYNQEIINIIGCSQGPFCCLCWGEAEEEICDTDIILESAFISRLA
ncbi:uncharacterized protein [Solanum lycopersicum]|uniref:uncharacterized protein isoform X2 n=1 Tax=Solanum lycopersicum TaxID=4081 RepID=UPI000532C6C4